MDVCYQAPVNQRSPTAVGTHLQVAFSSEGAPADVAHKGLFSRVRPLVDLKGTGGREVLSTARAAVLLGLSAWLRY